MSEDHVGDAGPEREADDEHEVAAQCEQDDEQAEERVAGDDHPALGEAHADEADDEAADQVAGAAGRSR